MNKNINHLMMFVFAFLMLFAFYEPSKVHAYDDVPPTHSNYEDVMFLIERNIIGENALYPFSKLGVSETVSRQEVISMIGVALGLDGTPRKTQFRDVSIDTRSGYIQSAVDAGIVNGYSDGTFRPHDFVTRGHVAAFISRAFDLPKGEITFKDVPVGHTAYKAVSELAAANITSGYDDGTFKPSEKLTRGHLITFIARAIRYTENNNL